MKKVKTLASLLMAVIIVVSTGVVSASAAGPDNWEDQIYWDVQYGIIKYVPAGVECYQLFDYAYLRYKAYNNNYLSVRIYNSQGQKKADQDLVATGDVLRCITGKADRHVISVFGDVNGDGSVTVTDVTALRGLIMDGVDEIDYLNPYHCAGDINKDGHLTVTDVVALQGLIV